MKINAAFLLMIKKVNKYQRHIRGKTAEGNNSDGILIDVYDVLKAFGVTCPATQHAIKKMLMAGERGHKDEQTDLEEAIQSLQRALELAQ
jgi:hypothetical protein